MLYEINGEYYIRRGRKYTKVNVIGTGENINLKPDMNKIIEGNDKLKVKEISFSDLKKAKRPSSTENSYDR